MKKFIFSFAVMLSFSAWGRLDAAEPAVDLGAPEAGVRTEISEITAKINEIDYSTRKVTLEDDKGGTLTVRVDDQVQNLKKVKKGDMVVIKYQQSLAWRLLKKKEKQTKTVTQTKTTGTEGKKPAVTTSEQTDIIATITNIDKKAPSVTLKGPDGNLINIQVKNPQVLEAAKTGDQVAFSYTESIAASIVKAKK